MDSPGYVRPAGNGPKGETGGYVRPAGNGPKGETGTAVKYLKTESLKKARRF